MAKHILTVADISDLHCGGATALMPPVWRNADGLEIRQSREQAWIWDCWQDMAQQVKAEALGGAEVFGLFNGDIVEGRHHETPQLVSVEPEDHADIAVECIDMVAAWCKRLMFICGTEAHAGRQGRTENIAARVFAEQGKTVIKPNLGPLYVWPAALLFPVAVPLGLGQVWERVEDALTSAFEATPFEDWIPLRAFELEPLLPGAELLCVMLGLLVPCLLGFGVIRQAGQRFLYLLAVLAMALGMSALSAALSYGPVHAWTWLDLPVMLGLVFGCVVALIFLPMSARTAWAFLLLAVLVQQSVLNQSPESAYFAQTLQTWEQGQFVRFHGLVQWLGWLWPYAVMLLALVRLSRERSAQN